MATYYIDPAGDDSTGDGSSGNPWLNLVHALGETSVSDTIIVKVGTYLNQDPIPAASVDGRVRGKTIIGESSNPRETILDFNGGECQFNGALATNSDNFTMENLTIRNIRLPFTRAFLSVHRGTVNAENCIFSDIGVGGTTNDGLLQGSFFENCNIVNVNKCVFIDCYRANAGVFCAFFASRVLQPTEVSVSSSVFYTSSATAPSGYTHISNFIAIVSGSASTFDVKNVIYQSDQVGVTDYTLNATPVTTYSCLFNTDYSAGETGVITTDPLFVDAPNGDFRLRPSSPCIGTGVVA